MNFEPIKPLSKEDLKRIRKIQVKMNHIATDLLAGSYRSAFKGKGVEFEESREFQSGDELRSVDWNVTARMGTPYVKKFREERELTIFLLVDISASTRFGSKNQLKSTLLSEIGAGLAFSGIKNQDKIGLVLFSDRIEHFLTPRKGIRPVLRLIRDLIAFPASGKGSNLEKALNFFGKVQKKRAVVFLLSDFLMNANYANEVKVMTKRHDLIAISVSDPLESHLPNVGLLPLIDLETGKEEIIDTSSALLNPFIRAKFLEIQNEARRSIEVNGGAWLPVSTDVSYINALSKFLLKKR